PYQVKKLFRNCWIIGRRFRLAHVRFGMKTIEVATFRKNVPAGSESEPATPASLASPGSPTSPNSPTSPADHDNTFGTPEEDAFRRDFTINALYADPDSGAVDDWFGGLADLDAGRVAFIGDPATRIAEDHLRILRFYRFAARFGRGALDAVSHAAVVTARQSLKSLSRERIADELLKILSLPDPRAAVGQMAADGIFEVLLPERDAGFVAAFDRLVANEETAGVAVAPLRRLAALLPADAAIAEQVASRLRLSTRQRKHLAALGGRRADNARPVRQLAHAIGVDAARDVHLLADDAASAKAAVAALSGWTVPEMPLKGGDIVARGIAVGPEVARILKAVEAEWVEEDFPDAARVAELVAQLVDQKIGRASD
ncbi:MAG: CCA tRNA nucleotidyltransferase, partial [Sphingopyxis sp.]